MYAQTFDPVLEGTFAIILMCRMGGELFEALKNFKNPLQAILHSNLDLT